MGRLGVGGGGWGWGPASTFRRPLSFSQFLCRFLAFGKILTQSGPPSPLLPFIFLTENSMSSAHSVMTQTGFILHPHADTDWPVLTPMFTQAGLSSPRCLHRSACPHPHVYTDRPVLTPMFTQTGLSLTLSLMTDWPAPHLLSPDTDRPVPHLLSPDTDRPVLTHMFPQTGLSSPRLS